MINYESVHELQFPTGFPGRHPERLLLFPNTTGEQSCSAVVFDSLMQWLEPCSKTKSRTPISAFELTVPNHEFIHP